MVLNSLTKTTGKKKKRVGRGYGSGKGGHTSGRGAKGRKARGKVGLLFEGTKMRKSLVKRLPLKRGKAKFKAIKQKPIIIKLSYLNLLDKMSEVTIDNLIKQGIVASEAKELGVKILGNGEIKNKLVIKVPISKSAQEKIEKVGGKVVR